jgi:hypothetical protein
LLSLQFPRGGSRMTVGMVNDRVGDRRIGEELDEDFGCLGGSIATIQC